MSHTNSALYSPYGAYELKSKYQRNFLIGTGATTAFVVILIFTFWLIGVLSAEEAINEQPFVIRTIADLGPPPTLAKTRPQIKVNQPKVEAPKVGIPKPVADDDVLDEDVMLATREEMAEIVAPDDMSGEIGDAVVDIDDYLPSMTEFIAVEIVPEMVHEVKPKYPRLAKQAGLEGIVWIKALVGKRGNVLDAVVFKSSGTQALDEAALKVAPQNKFKPAIQNGRPVAVWVTYRVVYTLDDN